ncbi:major facilitator superfamily protein, partial [Acidithiobacillus sp. GGI-221]
GDAGRCRFCLWSFCKALIPGTNTWRWLLAAEALLVLPYLLGRLTLPESARWCMGRGHNAEAARILERIVPRQKAMLDAMAQRLGKKIHHVAKIRPGRHMGIRTLFSPEYRRRTLLVTLPWFFMDVATYGVGLFTTILLGTMRNGENVGIIGVVGRDL